MKKAGKYFHQGFGRDALSIWQSAQVVADYRDRKAVQAAVRRMAKMWADHLLAIAPDATTATSIIVADTRTLAEGNWVGAVYVAAVVAATMAKRAHLPEVAAEMEALALTAYPY